MKLLAILDRSGNSQLLGERLGRRFPHKVGVGCKKLQCGGVLPPLRQYSTQFVVAAIFLTARHRISLAVGLGLLDEGTLSGLMPTIMTAAEHAAWPRGLQVLRHCLAAQVYNAKSIRDASSSPCSTCTGISVGQCKSTRDKGSSQHSINPRPDGMCVRKRICGDFNICASDSRKACED